MSHILDGAESSALIRLGLDPDRVTTMSLMPEKDGHRLFRLGTDQGGSVVLKLFDRDDTAEIQAYRLLHLLDVPTLPIQATAGQALLLEDVTQSDTWRLATAHDMETADVGAAVASWYRGLHARGAEYLGQVDRAPAFLQREMDILSQATIRQMAVTLGLEHQPIWDLVTEHLDDLLEKVRALPETLLYNDFHWSNLAVTRHPPIQAIVFDYHLLGIGPRVSDYRNVLSGLTGEAREAFMQAYGSIDEGDLALDAPLATRHALIVASQRPRLPSWARSLVQEVKRGTLAEQVHRALPFTLGHGPCPSQRRPGRGG